MIRRTLLGDWRNLAIGILSLLVIALAIATLPGILPFWTSSEEEESPGEPLSVLDVILDRQNLRSLDFVFSDAPGQASVGEILGQPPAEIEPALGGVWRWHGDNILRLEATDRFAPATEYEITLNPESVLGSNQFFTGESSFTVVTDQFQVELLDTYEEFLDQRGEVIIRGDIHFNYPVDPRELLPKMSLIDPLKGSGSPLPIHLETTYRSGVISFRTELITKQSEARELELVIHSSLTPAIGNVPLPKDFTKMIPIGSAVQLTIRGFSSFPGEEETSLVIQFSSPVSSEEAQRYLKIDPEVPFRFSSQRNQLSLVGDFQPGTEYTLEIQKGLPAIDESALQEAFRQEILIPDLEPSVQFRHEGSFLSRSGYHNLEIETMNLDKVEMVVDRVYLNNLFFLFEYYSYQYQDRNYYQSRLSRALGDRIAEEILPIKATRNQLHQMPLELDQYIQDQEPGLYRVGIRRTDYYSGEQRWVLITDLGIVAKGGDQDFLVWVSSFRNLGAVANARVRLISSQNQLIAEGFTDTRGLWRLPSNAKDLSTHNPFMVTVEKGNDSSFLLLNASVVDQVGLDVGGSRPSKTGYQAYVYGERDIYRPGETANGVAVIRGADLRTPPTMPLLMRHRDPQGRLRETFRLEMDRDGLAEFATEIPPYELTGHHNFEVLVGEDVIGSYRFQVEEFVPDRIKVEIKSDRAESQLSEDLNYTVTSAYLFGPPAAGLPVETTVRLKSATFFHDAYPEFTFTNPDREFIGREVYQKTAALDEKGEAEFNVELLQSLEVPSSLEAFITARVQEQGGRGVTALRRQKIHPYPHYVGLRRLGESYAEPGQEAEFEYAIVNPDGSPGQSPSLKAELYHDRWQTVLRMTPSGNYRYESTRDPLLVSSQNLAPGQSRGSFRFTPPEFGSYRVVLTDRQTGASSALEFYASGWGYSPWAIKNPTRLEIDLDREEYTPGSTAVAQIKAPFSGKLLVSVETNRILQTQIHTLTGNTAQIQIPVRGNYRPNTYVTATLIRTSEDLEEGSVARAFGAVPMYVDKNRNQLSPTIQAPDQILPDSDLTVEIRSAPNSHVTLAAVDEGILQLVAQKTADPFGFFYKKLALSVDTFDIFALLLPEIPPIEASPAGGGLGEEGMGQFVRTEGIRRVKPVRFWSGVVPTDSSGRARIEFHVPEFQGALRLMAVGLRGDQFGSTDKMMRVRSPLVILPTFPRFLSLDETVLVPVTVRNDTGRPGNISVGIQVTGPATVEGPATQTLELPNASEQTAYFTLKTGQATGGLNVVLTATGNGERSRATVDLSLRPDLPFQTAQSVGRIEAVETNLPLDTTMQFRSDTLTRELRISPRPLVQFSAQLSNLLRYPYGCLEQTISRVFPLLYFDDLAKEMEPDLFQERSAASLVESGLRRLQTMQLHSGGFGMWPGSITVYPWGSVYATHFLIEAQKAGYHVDDYSYRQAIRYVSSLVTRSSTYSQSHLEQSVYALYALARAGEADLGTMDFIRQNHTEELRRTSRALLGAAYAAAGNPQVSQLLSSGISDVESADRETGQNLNSTIRNRALLLLALNESDPADSRIPGLIDRLARDVTTSWWTTQENGFAFLALGSFFRQQEETARYSGVVLVGGRELGRFNQETAVFNKISGIGPLTIRMEGGYNSGAAFFSLATRGIPTDESFSPTQQGLEIRREYLTRDGQVLNELNVEQGDLVVAKTRIRSLSGPVNNVVISMLLPSGLEVENPRLDTTETLPWMVNANMSPDYLDLRDDRVLMFIDIPKGNQWRTSYALLRAVAPGQFRMPPLQAEAMYNPAIRATGARATMTVEVRQ